MRILRILSISTILFFLSNILFAHDEKIEVVELTANQLEQVILYGEFTGQSFNGKVFNQSSNITITQITIEAIPSNEENPFNKFSPRFFNHDIQIKPRLMSQPFSIDTGALKPEFHTSKIFEANGYVQK
jgi:hypothetical protein